MFSQYQPLFLKYRPQAISELVGQGQIALTIANAIKYGRISHAYLFTGPRGTGKTSAARIFAKSLNCEQGPTVEPCQKCTSCIEIKQGISPSVFEIDAASNNSVDDARLLIERAPLSACGGRFKLYIIDECHMLTKEAFNALLKTIEEPPANVIFILATTEEHKVLPTIISRCQKLTFRLVNEEAMLAHLSKLAEKENITIEKEALKAIAGRANGGLRDALSLLDQISLLGGDGQTISTEDVLQLTGALPEDILKLMCINIFKRKGKEVLSLLKELLVSGREAHLIVSELAKYLLKVAKATCGEEQSGESADLANLIDQTELIQMIEDLDRLEASCRRSSQPVMNLEIGILSLCQRLDIVQWKNIESRLKKLESAIGLNDEGVDQSIEEKAMAPLDKSPGSTREKSVAAKVKLAEEEETIKPDIEPEINGQKEQDISEKQDLAESKKTPIEGTKLDIVWQNILAELQRRHLPTFSLVSTHAFPIGISENVLSIGVFVENFQKMIENKIEYIKMAALSCDFDKNLKIIVRVENSQPFPSGVKKNEIDQSALATGKLSPAPQAGDQGSKFTAEASLRINELGRMEEAYRLFEGPGSRYIAPSQ